MNHETHLSRQQTPQKKNDWIPRPDENYRRPESHQPPAQSRSEKSFCLSLKTDSRFPKSLRLRTRREFQRVSKEGQRRVGKYLCVDVRLKDTKDKNDSLKLGISASGRYGSSPERNRFKRLVREAFRTGYSSLPSRLELNVIPRQCAKKASCQEIQSELLRLLKPPC